MQHEGCTGLNLLKIWSSGRLSLIIVMNFWLSLKVWNFLSSQVTICFSRRPLLYRVSIKISLKLFHMSVPCLWHNSDHLHFPQCRNLDANVTMLHAVICLPLCLQIRSVWYRLKWWRGFFFYLQVWNFSLCTWMQHQSNILSMLRGTYSNMS
jgi:hypothetical protein